MRHTDHHIVRRLCLVALLALLAAGAPAARPALAASFVVNSTGNEGDANTADGVCQTASSTCTLRAAIEQANVSGSGTISFNIPTSDSGYSAAQQIWTIRPSAPSLPAITAGNLTIDGSTQPNARSTGPKIELDGSAFTSTTAAFRIQSSGNTINGFVINRFPVGFFSTGGIGVYLEGATANNNTITNNWIGLDSTGTTAAPNTFMGIYINGGSNNVIRGNVISGNGTSTGTGSDIVVGQFVAGSPSLISDGNVIAGNKIGTNAAGTAAIGGAGNSQDGIYVGYYVTNTTIGGTTVADRNIIGGHTNTNGGTARAGVRIEGTGNASTVVRGNYIGVDVNGTAAIPNVHGVIVRDSVTTPLVIGNIISGNQRHGVLVEALTSSVAGVTIQDNLIGVSASGGALGNQQAGISFNRAGSSTTIGVGSSTIRGNTVSANTLSGITIGVTGVAGSNFSGNVIAGNYIGTATGGASTSTALVNGQSGVVFLTGTGNTVGGPAAADKNVIAARANQAAVRFTGSGSTGNTVRGNSIGVTADGQSVLVSDTTQRGGFGVLIDAGAGSSTVGPGNVIGGNDSGIQLNGGSGNTVAGNKVGVAPDGITGVGNTQFGIWLLNTSGNTIGGSGASGNTVVGSGRQGIFIDGTSPTNTLTGNTITDNQDGILLNSAGASGTIITSNTVAHNRRDGVRVNAATGVRISQTATFDNIGDGIDLLSGGNGGRAAPTLSATLGSGPGGVPVVTGTATGCSSPGCVVEIFTGAARDDGEGPRYLAAGTADPTTGAFTIDVSGCDRFLTATARDPVTNNTSAFTNPMVDTGAGCSSAAPTLSAGTPASSSASPQTVAAGSSISYLHTLTNSGGLAGTFTIAASSAPQGWPTALSRTSVALNAGQSVTIAVTVTVPLGAIGGTPEATTVSASVGGLSDSKVDYTRTPQTFGVDIQPPGSLQFTQSPSPVTLDYTHIITNTGNGTDTITISAQNLTIGGSPTFSYPSGSQCANLARGASCTLTVRVQLPANSTGGTFRVTATGGGSASASVVDTAFTQSVIPQLTTVTQKDAFPSDTVTFVHTLTNAGSQTGTFTPTLTLPAPLDGWSYSFTPNTSFTLGAGVSRTLVVTATVPGIATTGAISGTIKTATLQVAASSGAVATAADSTRVLLKPQFTFSAATQSPAAGLPGATVTFTHTLQNTSNGDDRYTIVVTPTANLQSVVVSPASPVSVARGASATVTIRATVKPGTLASVGVEQLAVTAQSVSLPRPSPQSQTDAVTVLGADVPVLSVSPASRSGPPGGPLRFTYTLTNTGNQAGTFAAPAFTLPSGQPGWGAVVVGPAPACITGGQLAAGASCTFDVDVTSPAGAFAGTNTIRVSVSSTTTPSAPAAIATSSVVVSAVPTVQLAPNRSGTANPGQQISYTHFLTNTGNVTDTYTFSVQVPAGWTAPAPATLASVPPGASRTVVLSVTPPAVIGAGQQGVVVLKATAGTSPNPFAQVTDTTTIASIDAASLTPASQTASGVGGTTVFFFPTLKNTGSTTIGYDLSVTTAGWTSIVTPTSTAPLAPGETRAITVSVTIPGGTPIGVNNLTTLSVRKAGSGAPVLATGQYTATTTPVGSLLTPTSNSSTALPSATVTYTHTLRNITGQAGTFTLRTIATNGWQASVAPASVFLDPGGTREVVVTLIVPPARPMGEQDYTYIEVQSVADPSVGARGTEVTTIGRFVAAELSPSETKIVAPGDVVDFQPTLLHDGNALDTFHIQATDQLGWQVQVTVPSPPSATLIPGATFPVEVRVTVPAGVPRNTLNRITITATSQADPSVVATVQSAVFYPPDNTIKVVRYKVALPLVDRP